MEVTTKILNIDSRVLLYIVGEIILCKNGNYYIANDAELFLMWAMLEREPIKTPSIILKRMIYIARLQTSPLPHVSLIAHIFKVLKADAFVVMGNYILPTKANNATLKKMGYIK